MLKQYVLLVLLVLVAACSSLGRSQPAELKKGVSSEQDVIRFMGQPERVWENGDGSKTYEYSMQPLGDRCYMVTLDVSGKVRRVEQVITLKNIASIRPGMRKEAVERLLGKPGKVQTTTFIKGEEAWDWTIDATPSMEERLTVYFRQGVVVRKETALVLR